MSYPNEWWFRLAVFRPVKERKGRWRGEWAYVIGFTKDGDWRFGRKPQALPVQGAAMRRFWECYRGRSQQYRIEVLGPDPKRRDSGLKATLELAVATAGDT